MRKLVVGGLGFALLAGLSVAIARGDDTPPKGKSGGNWFSNWFGAKKKDADKKPDAKPANGTVTAGQPDAVADESETLRAREQAALLRRLEVCDKLREIALQTNDAYLEGQAVQLEERAGAAYARRTAHLPGAPTGFELDEEILDKHAKTGAATGLLPALSPAAANPKGRNGGSAALGGKR